MWLSPGREILVISTAGNIMRAPHRATSLESLVGDRLFVTRDAPASPDLTGGVDVKVVLNADFSELLAVHRERIEPLLPAVHRYEHGRPEAAHRANNLLKATALEATGLARFTDPTRTRWRYTPRGAFLGILASFRARAKAAEVDVEENRRRSRRPRPGDPAYQSAALAAAEPPRPPGSFNAEHFMPSSIEQLAARHQFSLPAVQEALTALRRGGGSMAQFNHPELGGSGQWLAGSLMIGDMFNDALKARVATLFADLAPLAKAAESDDRPGPASSLAYGFDDRKESWYPASLGFPNTTGDQNGVRYAFFAGTRRLAIQIGGRLTLYDTADHRIGGVAQDQSSRGGSLTFTSQHGTVSLQDLRVVEA